MTVADGGRGMTGTGFFHVNQHRRVLRRFTTAITEHTQSPALIRTSSQPTDGRTITIGR